MTIRFSMTPRLLGLTVFSLLTLLVLMFLLGIQIGKRLAAGDPIAAVGQAGSGKPDIPSALAPAQPGAPATAGAVPVTSAPGPSAAGNAKQ